MTDPVKTAQNLIRCPSVTPKDEGALSVLIDILEPLGFECHNLPYENVPNLFARLGTGAPHICFCGHTDVVPAGDEANWRHPPFGGEIDEGILYGRGAVDMKGAIACFAAAIAGYINDNGPPDGSISLLITGDEEGPAINGTVKVLKWMKENGHVPDFFLGGEPTNPAALGEEIKIGRRGSLTATLTVTGKQGHSAYPALADNPLPRLVKMLDALASYTFDEGTDHFQPTNLEIASIDTGNQAANVIPVKSTALINVRFNNLWSAASLEKKMRAILDDVNKNYTLACASNAESFMTEPGRYTELVAGAVQNVTGKTPAMTTNGGTSDARFCTHYAPVVECGLINATAHHVDEHIAVKDLQALTAIYKDILARFFL